MNIRKKIKIDRRIPCVYGKIIKLPVLEIYYSKETSSFYQTNDRTCKSFYKPISTIC